MYRNKKYYILLFFLLIKTIWAADIVAQEEQLNQENPTVGIDSLKVDRIPVAYGSLQTDQIVGNITVIEADEILKLNQQQNVIQALVGRVPALYTITDRASTGFNFRNYGAVIFYIDGLERDPSYLTLNEVDKIVILKDAPSRMLMGVKGNNGVVLITTKRGLAGEKIISSNFEYGIETPVSYPEFMNAYNYARLFNEARANDGLAPLYSDQQLEGYKSGSRIRYPDVDYYNSTFLRNHTNKARFSTQFQGGNEKTRYFLNLTGTTNNSLLNVGEGKKQGNDNFHIRGNVDTKITSFITLSVDLASYFGFEHKANGNFFGDASKFRPNDYPLFIPTDSVPSASSGMLTSALKNNGGILGGTQTYQTNVYGYLKHGGYTKVNNRINQMNTKLDVDLSSIVNGLHFIGGFNFDMAAIQTIELQNTYSVYEPVYAGSVFSNINKYRIDLINPNQGVKSTEFTRRFGFYGNFEYNRSFGDHRITSNLMGHGGVFNKDLVFQTDKTAHYGLRVNYGFKGKYIVEFDGAYTGSGFLPESNRFSFAPSMGAAWVVNNEDFMGQFTKIDFLKIFASWGIINTDAEFAQPNPSSNLSPNIYNAFTTSYLIQGGSYAYGGITGDYFGNAVRYKSIANNDLSFGKKEDINIGFEGSFFNNKLQLSGTYYYRNEYNYPTKLSYAYPEYLGDMFPVENAGKNRYTGVEASVLFQKNEGDFRYSVGGNFVYSTSKVIEIDEPFYKTDNQKRIGKPVDAIFAYVSEGLFANSTEISEHEPQTFGNVLPGDIKYKDLNADGLIDQQDQTNIGNYLPNIYYGINFTVGYRNIDLFVLGTGQAGSDFILNGDYYWVRGNLKYPSYLENARWTPEKSETATFPRLSSTESSNNFRNSTFWLRKNDWMKLHTVQLSYTLPKSVVRDNGIIKGIRIYLRGSNLFAVSDTQKEHDLLNLSDLQRDPVKPENVLKIGNAPQMRSFSIGLNANF